MQTELDQRSPIFVVSGTTCIAADYIKKAGIFPTNTGPEILDGSS
jgi:hypothetical protein